MSMRLWFLTSLAALASTAAAGHEPVFPEEEVTAKIRTVSVTLEVARTVEEHRHGFMYRESLPVNHGMLFVLPEPRPISLWMKNTPMDLDAAFLDDEGCIFQIVHMDRESLTLHRSVAPAAYAVEISRGWFAANGITKGTCFKGLPTPDPKHKAK